MFADIFIALVLCVFTAGTALDDVISPMRALTRSLLLK
jgi:hypothetical protein